MPVTKTMPKAYLVPAARDMEPGDRWLFSEGALEIDLDGRGWIDPFASPLLTDLNAGGSAQQALAGLVVGRTSDGYVVNLNRINPSAWPCGAKPQPKYGVEWLPVFEFVSP